MSKKMTLIAISMQLIWSLMPINTKIILKSIPIELYATLKWTISSLLLLTYSKYFKLKVFRWNYQTLQIGLVGIFGFAVSTLAFGYGIKKGGIINFALLACIGPLITASVSKFFFKETWDKLFLVSMLACLIGLFLINKGKISNLNSQIHLLASIIIILGLFLETLPFVYSKVHSEERSIIEYLTLIHFSSSLFSWVVLSFKDGGISPITSIDLNIWFCILINSLIGGIGCYAILYWLLKHTDGYKLAMFDSINIVSTIALGYLFFNEKLEIEMVLGGCLIISSIYSVIVTRQSH